MAELDFDWVIFPFASFFFSKPVTLASVRVSSLYFIVLMIGKMFKCLFNPGLS